MELKKILYDGVRTTTFSAGLVSLRTVLEMVGITPELYTSHWGSTWK